jgi:outer membrane protein assembly factor BamB
VQFVRFVQAQPVMAHDQNKPIHSASIAGAMLMRVNLNRKPRIVPPWPLLLVLVSLLTALVWLKIGDGMGDGGMNNVISYAVCLLGATIYWLWFVLCSRQSGRLRTVMLLVGSCGFIGAISVVRIDSWTGSMIPKVRWAWREPRDSQLPSVEVDGQDEVDLVSIGKDDFPGFLGQTRTATVPHITLSRDWTLTPPDLLWRVPCGSGWSGFAVVNDVAITQEQRRGQQVIVARSLADGSELWRYAQDGGYYSNLAGDGPRATPLVHDGLVFASDPLGRLTCLDGRDGSFIWGHDLREMYGLTKEREGQLIGYGRASSPIVHEGQLIVAAGGDLDGKSAGIVAFSHRNGELLWEGPPRQLSYASPNVVTLAGRHQVVVTNESSVSGHDPETGDLLWEYPWPGSSSAAASNSQPTPVGAEQVLISKGYGQGSAMLRLVPSDGDRLDVEVVWKSRRSLRTKFTNPVVHASHIYALSDGILECVALETGKRVWRKGRYGHGQVLLVGLGVDALLLVMAEDGRLLLVDPRPDMPNEVLGEIEAFDEKVWNTLAVSGDRLVVRNAIEAACFRLPLAGK